MLYNFSDVPLPANKYHHVMDYPFPKCEEAEKCEPPDLDAIFLVALEMKQWLNHQPDHVIVVHQHDTFSSNPCLILACFLAMANREQFPSGASQVLTYVARMWNHFSCTRMSEAQMSYIKYFDQVLVG
jgi:hypothetical protein